MNGRRQISREKMFWESLGQGTQMLLSGLVKFPFENYALINNLIIASMYHKPKSNKLNIHI